MSCLGEPPCYDNHDFPWWLKMIVGAATIGMCVIIFILLLHFWKIIICVVAGVAGLIVIYAVGSAVLNAL